MLKFTMNERTDKQTDGRRDDGESVHTLTFPSLVIRGKKINKGEVERGGGGRENARGPNFTRLLLELEHSEILSPLSWDSHRPLGFSV